MESYDFFKKFQVFSEICQAVNGISQASDGISQASNGTLQAINRTCQASDGISQASDGKVQKSADLDPGCHFMTSPEARPHVTSSPMPSSMHSRSRACLRRGGVEG